MGLRPWHLGLKPAVQWQLPRIDLFLKLHVPFNDVCVAADRRGEEPYRPEFVPPRYRPEPGKPCTHLAAGVGFEFSNDGRHGILWGDHHYQMDMINLYAELLDFHIRVKLLDVEQPFLQVQLEVALEDLFPILRNPHNVILMVVGAVGTQSDLHARRVSKPPSKNLFQPSAGGFHPRADARGPQPGS